MSGVGIVSVVAGWDGFLACADRIGRDITMVQGAGGNASIKDGDTLWIKASGSWLADAQVRPIMVPVNLDRMRARVMAGDLDEAEIAGLTRPGGPSGMRASVETPFHALLPARVVLHVHCLATLGHAISVDAQARLASRLAGLNWHWQPYIKPGVPLTNALRDASADRAQVIVLGNHGLITSGPTPAEAEALLHDVQHRLGAPVTPSSGIIAPLPVALKGTGYAPSTVPGSHDLALQPQLRRLASNCAVAPDFVVFFGPAIPVLTPGPDLPAQLRQLATQPAPLNSVVLIAGHGALIREDAMRGTEDLLFGYARMLKQFLAHGGGSIRHLTPDETAALLNWDAEKYRQSLNGGAPDA